MRLKGITLKAIFNYFSRRNFVFFSLIKKKNSFLVSSLKFEEARKTVKYDTKHAIKTSKQSF